MKHEHLFNNTDHAEIAAAGKVMAEGRRIKARVLSRVRMRAWRERAKTAKSVCKDA